MIARARTALGAMTTAIAVHRARLAPTPAGASISQPCRRGG